MGVTATMDADAPRHRAIYDSDGPVELAPGEAKLLRYAMTAESEPNCCIVHLPARH